MKRTNVLAVVLIFSSLGFAQLKVNSSTKEYINNSLWSQVFNDFEVNMVFPVVTPWLFGFGSVNYIDNDVFTKNLIKENNQFSTKNMVFREVVNSLKVSFLNYLPIDSIMRIKAMYKNRVLYTFDISQNDTSTVTDFNVPSKSVSESISFDKNGNLRYYTKSNFNGNTSIENTFLKPDVAVCTIKNSESSEIIYDKRYYNEKKLKRKILTKKLEDGSKEVFVSDENFNYLDNMKLRSSINYNKKGNVIDSVVYLYDNDTLKMVLKLGKNGLSQKIVYTYPNVFNVIKKIEQNDQKYEICVTTKNQKTSRITFNEIVYGDFKAFDFEYNKNNQLITVSNFNTLTDIEQQNAPKKQFMFYYNESNNIKSIKVVDSNGIIGKEINFEYEFL